MDGIIDIIIAILFIAIPTIFKAIGNKLEKSGKAEKAGKFKKIAESFSDEEGESTIEGWILEQMEDPAEEVVEPVAEAPKPAYVEAVPVVKKKPVMLVEEKPEKKGEKIDPKKLVIYSEIMKPKY